MEVFLLCHIMCLGEKVHVGGGGGVTTVMNLAHSVEEITHLGAKSLFEAIGAYLNHHHLPINTI